MCSSKASSKAGGKERKVVLVSFLFGQVVYMYICMYVCMYIYIYIYIYKYTDFFL